MRKGFRALVFISLVLCSGGAQALGLGEPSVKSFLNQPLEVEIELLSLTTAEAESVIARLASIEDYQRVGIAPMRLSVPLNFTVFATSARTFILVESTEAVHDPVVQLLLDVNWSGGRLLKEYTLFLDPPTFDVAPPRVSLAPRPEPEQPPAQPVTSRPEAPPATAPPRTAAPRIITSAEAYGPIQSGETLWRIASNWISGSGYTINQAMVAIALANPQAFTNGNINRMQRGEVLRMPERAEVGRISRSEADRTVAEHTDAWRRNVPLTAPPPVVSEAGTDVDTVADTAEPAETVREAAAETTPEVTAPELPQARLELVPTEVDVDDFLSGRSTADSERHAQLNLVQELLHQAEAAMRTGDGENEALAAEIENLRATVLELSRAMNIDDEDLATLAARTRETRNRDKDVPDESLDDLLTGARDSLDDTEGVAAEEPADEPQPAEAAEVDEMPMPSWWEQTWFISLLGAILLIGIVMLLRRGARTGPADYGQTSLADALIEEEEEHVDYSAADMPGVDPETIDDDLSTLTEEAENILRALEEENQEVRGDDPESIYEPPIEQEDFSVEIDGTTVSTINVDEDELAQLMAEKRSDAEDGGDDSAGEQDMDEFPEGDDVMESKLDLAIAYIESDDAEKARELLEEIREGGDEDQKAMAQKFLDEL